MKKAFFVLQKTLGKTAFGKAFIVLALFLMLVSAGALTFNVKESIPANSSWTFNVNLDSYDFDEARVYLNDEQLLSVYTYGNNKTIIENDSSKIILSSIDGLSLTVSMSSLSAGDYSIKVSIYKDNVLLNEETTSFQVFEALPESFKNETQSQFDSLNETTSNIENKVTDIESSFNENISQIKSNINEVNSELQETRNDLTLTNDSIDSLNSKLAETNSAQEQKIKELEGKLAIANQELASQALKLNKPKSTGFASIAGVNPAVGLLFFALIILLAALFFEFNKHPEFFKFKSREPEEETPNAKEPEEDSTEEDWKGRWAFQPNQAQERRFSLGDLIKKEK